MSEHLWTVVLAGGAGRRLAQVTGGIPKQFWHYDGSQSLLESTLVRVSPFAPPERTLVVVDRTHRPFVNALPGVMNRGSVLYQPMDRGTAAGVGLPLTQILEQGPEAIVLLTPSDHAVARPSHFRVGIREAVAHVQSGKSDVVLFGVEPTTPNGDYGWIAPAHAHGSIRRVGGFVEKPSRVHALRLFTEGSIWNSMVMVARAAALHDLYWKHLPELGRLISRGVRLLPSAREPFLIEQYHGLPHADFSRDLLAVAADLSVYTWPIEMGWSDLGTPERFEQWVEALAVA
jgi:mannose-1-phosphate guanylyltransferase